MPHHVPSTLQPRPIQKYIPFLIGLLTTALYTAAFPPFNVAEAAYLFAVPLLTWSFFHPRFKTFAITTLASGILSWLILLSWVRHVTWLGTLLLALALSLFLAAWFLAAYWALPRLVLRPVLTRLSGLSGLAGLWVLIEWLRSFIFTGFPWLPLAASQWQQPVMLQPAAWVGSYGVSFLLIFFNLALAAYGHHLTSRHEATTLRKQLCPEFYLALLILLGAISLFWHTTQSQPHEREPLFTAAAVQPYIPQSLKWNPNEAKNHIAILAQQTTLMSERAPDILLWPETATPWPVIGEPLMREWIETLARKQQRPLLIGSFSKTPQSLHNSIFLITPATGLDPQYYIKRKLVPFGEYVPLRGILPFVTKAVPIQEDFSPGQDAALLTLVLDGTAHRIGPLICYEDIFPHLARTSVAAGADVLFVATNNSWFGEEGGAYQHAAHSVLRAVETRRPVIRCGNSGWSGWIDEYGRIRTVVTNAAGSIYFRGGAIMAIDRDPQWREKQSFYVRYGDRFVAVCLAFTFIGWLSTKRVAITDKPS